MSQTSAGHPPEDFDWILSQYNNDDIEPIIIAGQAVNIWGKTFREWDAKYNPTHPRIEDLLPLTSNDMELLEFRGVSAIGKFKGVVGSEKTAPFAKAASPDTATYHLESKAGLLKSRFLRGCQGPAGNKSSSTSSPLNLASGKPWSGCRTPWSCCHAK